MTRDLERILRGSYTCPPEIHPGAKDYIQVAKIPSSILESPPVSAVISPEEYRDFWKTQHEYTQS